MAAACCASMETSRVTLSLSLRVAAVLSCLALVAGCSSVGDFFAGEKIDYRSTSTTRMSGLEVPPDLTQLSKESRYQQSNGAISASTFQSASSAPVPTMVPVIAPQTVGAFK